MSQALHAILLLAAAAAAVTLAASLAAWWLDPERRLRRALATALGGPPAMALICPAAGQGVALRLHRPGESAGEEEALALVREPGALALVFTLDELQGVELIFDGQVVARAFRGEGRRALDVLAPEVRQAALRLVFDDVREPEATLELYDPAENERGRGRSAAEAVREGRLWLTRLEAVVRRPRG